MKMERTSVFQAKRRRSRGHERRLLPEPLSPPFARPAGHHPCNEKLAPPIGTNLGQPRNLRLSTMGLACLALVIQPSSTYTAQEIIHPSPTFTLRCRSKSEVKS